VRENTHTRARAHTQIVHVRLYSGDVTWGWLAPQSILVFDLSGWALWHLKYLSYIKALVDIVQSQYPERLSKALLVNVPGLFMAAWKLISPWIDPKTRSKIFFVRWLRTTTAAPYGGWLLHLLPSFPPVFLSSVCCGRRLAVLRQPAIASCCMESPLCLSLSLSLSRSLYLSIYLSIYPSIHLSRF
jgi:hypothetical protein